MMAYLQKYYAQAMENFKAWANKDAGSTGVKRKYWIIIGVLGFLLMCFCGCICCNQPLWMSLDELVHT